MTENWDAKANAVIEWLKAGMKVSAAAKLSGFSEVEVIGLANSMPSAASHSNGKGHVHEEKTERNAEIKRRFEAGERVADLARAFNVDDHRIRQLLNKGGAQNWLHVKNRDEKAAKANGHHEQKRVAQYAMPRQPATRRAALPLEARQHIADRYATGESTHTIASDYGIEPQSVAWVANKQGKFRPGFGPGISVIQKIREVMAAEQATKIG